MGLQDRLTGKTLQRPGGTIRYYLSGKEASTKCLFFLSGIYGSKEDWAKQEREFAKRYKNFFIEYRNIDIEDDERIADKYFNTIADDIESVARLEEVQDMAIIAHSIGGAIALNLAVRYPGVVSRIVLINSGTEVGLHLKLVIKSMLRALENNIAMDLIYPFVLPWWYSGDYLEHIVDFQANNPASMEKIVPGQDRLEVIKKLMLCSLEIPEVLGKLETIRIPVLLITLSNDFGFPVERQKELLSGLEHFQVKTIEGFGHNVHLEHYKLVNDMILTFLEQ